MKLSSLLSSISLALYASTASAINPLVIKGNKFFDKETGDQFYIKGVAYQPGRETGTNKDPLANPSDCKRDIQYFKDLDLNTIRVYQVDYTLNHDDCMNALAENGIYLVLDLSTPKYSINRADPYYDLELLNHYKKTIDAFADYPNVLGFFAGNEVVNKANATSAAPFVKASIRDIKAYLKTKSRYIPVGYSTNDDAAIRVQCADYFNCGEADDRVDFYGYNIYSWCGDATYESSGYAARTEQFSTYSVPVFFSEFGCNTVGVRNFDQVQAIYGPQMDQVFSGAIAYEYTEEANHYGLVTIEPDGEVEEMPCYKYFKEEMNSVNPSNIASLSSYTPSSNLKPSQCPAISSSWWASTKLPPTPSEELCTSMYNSLKCVYSDKSETTPDTAQLYRFICGEVSCTDISANGTEGTYGKYSGCNPNQRLSYVFNKYYTEHGEKAQMCNFNGFGAIVTPTSKGPSNSSDSDGETNQKNGAQSLSIMSALTVFAVSVASLTYL